MKLNTKQQTINSKQALKIYPALLLLLLFSFLHPKEGFYNAFLNTSTLLALACVLFNNMLVKKYNKPIKHVKQFIKAALFLTKPLTLFTSKHRMGGVLDTDKKDICSNSLHLFNISTPKTNNRIATLKNKSVTANLINNKLHLPNLYPPIFFSSILNLS
jgi:hypothetical protein